MSDWPQEKPPPYPADDEGLVNPPERTALIHTLVRRILRDNAEAFRLLAEHDAPPPEVWEFYREHGRWPEPGEA